jgi:hypothetical protein
VVQCIEFELSPQIVIDVLDTLSRTCWFPTIIA